MNTDLRHQLQHADPASPVTPYPAAEQDRIIATILSAEIQPTAGPSAVARRGPGGGTRHRLRISALATGTAAAAALVLVLVPALARSGGTGGPGPLAGPSASREPITSATQVLHLAAVAALSEPAVTVPDSGFVYVASVGTDSGTGGRIDRRIWISVDGRHVGLLKQRPSGSDEAWQSTPLANEDCTRGFYLDDPDASHGEITCHAVPGYQGDLPTTPKAMLAWLSHRANVQGPTLSTTPHPGSTGRPDNVLVWIALGDLIREAYIPKQSRAALFEAAGMIPGVRLLPGDTDALGRPGISVGLDHNGSSSRLIFDPHTFAFLGEEESRMAGPATSGPATSSAGVTAAPTGGTTRVTWFMAVTQVGIVAKVGQIPGH